MTDEQRDYLVVHEKLVEEGIATEDEKGITLSTEAIQKDQWCVEFIAQEKQSLAIDTLDLFRSGSTSPFQIVFLKYHV